MEAVKDTEPSILCSLALAVFFRATEQHFGKLSLLKSGIILGHVRYIGGSFDPGSTKQYSSQEM